MSRNMKIVLGVVAVVLLIGCAGVLGVTFLGARMLGQAMDPAQVEEVAHQITDYTLPAGYKPIMGLPIMGVKMVMFGPSDMAVTSGSNIAEPGAGMVIMLMQAPAGADADAMREQMSQRMGSQAGGGNLTPTGTMDATIRGEAVKLQVSEGASRTGQQLRAVSGAFEGKGGPAMLMIMGNPESWDDAAVQSFLSSMK
jgi:hypothetical protein